jgi:hypothetical protein
MVAAPARSTRPGELARCRRCPGAIVLGGIAGWRRLAVLCLRRFCNNIAWCNAVGLASPRCSQPERGQTLTTRLRIRSREQCHYWCCKTSARLGRQACCAQGKTYSEVRGVRRSRTLPLLAVAIRHVKEQGASRASWPTHTLAVCATTGHAFLLADGRGDFKGTSWASGACACSRAFPRQRFRPGVHAG